MFEIERDPPRRLLRLFGGLWLPLFAAIMGAVLWRRGLDPAVSITVWAVGAGSLLFALAAPRLLKPVYLGLMIAAYPIGWVVSHVMLFLIYFGVVTPAGLLARALGKRPLAMTGDQNAPTYWKRHSQQSRVERYFRQY